MFEIGIPNFIKTSEFSSDPLKYNYYKIYKRGQHVVLVSHDGQFFSFLDIATTLKRFGILSLFIIINKTEEEYTFFIGNSFNPYDRILLHKSTIPIDKTLNDKLQATKKYIEMLKTLSNSEDLIIFPIGIEEQEVNELIGDLSLSYNFLDLTKYLIFTPIIEPMEKKVKPILITLVLAGAFFYGSSIIDDHFKYDRVPELEKEMRQVKQVLYKQMDIEHALKEKNIQLTKSLKHKNSIKVYNGRSDD